MKRFLIASVVAIAAVAINARATTVAQWTFESFSTNNVNTSGPLSPEWGAGTATAHHAGAATYSEPAGDVDNTIAASDAGAIHAGDNPSVRSWSANVWAVGDYWQFQVSTLGLTGVKVEWDQTGSNTGPRDFQLQYSVDGGTTFTPGGSYALAFASWNTSSALANSEIQTFAGAVDNQASVIFRLVDNSTTAINSANAVASAGTDRVDNFTVIAVPEPSTILMVGAGLSMGLMVMRRRRS